MFAGDVLHRSGLLAASHCKIANEAAPVDCLTCNWIVYNVFEAFLVTEGPSVPAMPLMYVP
jgi:hypothetical protein